MRRDKYNDRARAVEAFSTTKTTKMSATDVKRSVDSSIEVVLNKLDSIISLKEETTTAFQAFAEKEDPSPV